MRQDPLQMISPESSSSQEEENHDFRPGNHTVQFYEDISYIKKTVISLAYAALQKNYAVIIVADNRLIKAAESILPTRLNTFSKLKEEGQIKLYDAQVLLNQLVVNNEIDTAFFREHIIQVVRATQARYKNLWIYGEMVNLLWQRGAADTALQLENLWNELAQTTSFELVCGYQIANFKDDLEGQLFQAVCGQHNCVLPSESFLNLPESEDKNRNVAFLQQKNQALANEIIHHQEVKKLLTALVEEKTQQIYNISHEIKTPLTAIILQATALLRAISRTQNDENNKTIYKLMANIKVNTQRLNHLIHNLINIKSRTP